MDPSVRHAVEPKQGPRVEVVVGDELPASEEVVPDVKRIGRSTFPSSEPGRQRPRFEAWVEVVSEMELARGQRLSQRGQRMTSPHRGRVETLSLEFPSTTA